MFTIQLLQLMMSSIEITRRKTLIGAGLVIGGIAFTGQASARSDALEQELDTVRCATEQYTDVALARSDGYAMVSPYTPQMGFHFVNPERFASDSEAEVDITEPPILVYYGDGEYQPEPGDEHDDDRDDELLLGAVEFAHLGDDGEPGTPANYFSDEESEMDLDVSEEEGWNWTPGPDITALHVWVHKDNPDGVFSPTNPEIN